MGLINLEEQKKKQKHWLRRTIIAVILVIVVALFSAGTYFYHVAMVPGHKSFINNSQKIEKSDPLYTQKMWFKNAKKQQWVMTSATRNYRLDADYIPAAHKTTKNVVILHGFMGNKEKMGEYATLFHQMGYNVLMPDVRAHGQSQGKYIGYGWPERYDVRKWTKKLIAHNGQNSQVVIFGVSMGGATTMMTSGIQMPKQVKAYVEDCGYTNLNDELNYEAGNLYSIPTSIRWPLIKILSLMNRVRNGFYIGEASAVNSLHHNHRPMLFIHGSKDHFVPTEMVYSNYQASRGPKELWVVKGAAHASSFANNPTAYQHHIEKFLAKYVK
ncbi:alpha/beta hydrolase [Limosilactobacillus sp. Sa3CUN2]|uniref:Alpha/beta hydrolase n=1 Tax=Limosilactobacillus avistercoris TaxID=2762243 RepID=A0ABR8PC02_9LACO|nr:alpha/beta hydrolase [Limosilactobacillus avistercoris]MBD7894814.1 alpha/beta hydrolase [Limosilactobacillus avistercoris]